VVVLEAAGRSCVYGKNLFDVIQAFNSVR